MPFLTCTSPLQAGSGPPAFLTDKIQVWGGALLLELFPKAPPVTLRQPGLREADPWFSSVKQPQSSALQVTDFLSSLSCPVWTVLSPTPFPLTTDRATSLANLAPYSTERLTLRWLCN